MAIVAPLPNVLQNGTTADANQVQANFQWIVDQVNANAQPSVFTDLVVTTPPTTALVSGASTIVLLNGTKFNDKNSEIVANTFTAAHAGTYIVIATTVVTTGNTTTGIAGQLIAGQLFTNGSLVQTLGSASWPYADSVSRTFSVPGVTAIVLAAGDVMTCRINISAFAGTAPQGGFPEISVRRIV